MDDLLKVSGCREGRKESLAVRRWSRRERGVDECVPCQTSGQREGWKARWEMRKKDMREKRMSRLNRKRCQRRCMFEDKRKKREYLRLGSVVVTG